MSQIPGHLMAEYSACSSSPAYIRIPQNSSELLERIQAAASGNMLELEELVNAHSAAGHLEGFINGWAWAQATAKKCLQLRELQVVYSALPLYRGLSLVCHRWVRPLYMP